MTLADESNQSEDLPSLPDLAGKAGLGSAEGAGKQAGTHLSSELNQEGEDDAELADLPEVRVAKGDEAAAAIVAAQANADPYLGHQFGGYELVQKIGQGGMGLVYKGRQVSLDRVVAVKILNKALCDNVEFIKRFEREAKSIARINHPNIMAVYDFGQTGGVWYMVTEFIEGSSLSKQISDRVMLPVEDLAPLLVQCLAGLAYVGLQGIVHRDIKPDNILITKDGIAKIADFGLAKDVSRNDATDLTAVGLAMGTPAYMSPEQCMGRRLDGRSDIYSLGVAAYLALTGEKPFTGQSSFEIMTKQREFTPPPPRQLNPNIPREVSDLVMQMLAKNAQERFRDAEQCRQAWIELGQRLGFMGIAGLSNETAMLVGERARTARIATAAPPVAMPSPAAAPPPGMNDNLPVLPQLGRGNGESHRLAATEPPPLAKARVAEPAPPPPPMDGEAAKAPADRPQRPTTEKRAYQRGASSEAITCTRCGMLNRAELSNCSRCGIELRDSTNDPNAIKGQEVEAQRLLTNGSYREAAAIYARLADREGDRRARAVLRSKEREARTLEHQQQVSELRSRTQGLVNRGDIKAGIEVLERGLRDVRDVGASSTGAESELMDQISDLRGRLRHRRQLKLVLLAMLLLALAVGAILAKIFLFPSDAPKSAHLAHGPGHWREC